ncbi:MAG: TrkA family potassium uptake protein [Scrofimicrobium sp.]
MKIVVVGAGSVGRSIATALLESGHEVTLVDDRAEAIRVAWVPEADWVLADACSPSDLEELGARECDALVAVTGDDKVNLVVSLLAKTVFAVPRVIARANHTANEWMFNSNWGVDVLASTPRALTAMVEEAVSVGQAVQLLSLDQSATSVFTIEIPADSALIGLSPVDVEWPEDLIVSAIVRDKQPAALSKVETIAPGDELIVITGRGASPELMHLEDLVSNPGSTS